MIYGLGGREGGRKRGRLGREKGEREGGRNEGGREGGRERGRGEEGKEREGHDSITIEGGDLFRVELNRGDGDALGQELNIREHTVVCRHSKWHLCPVDGQRNTCTHRSGLSHFKNNFTDQ